MFNFDSIKISRNNHDFHAFCLKEAIQISAEYQNRGWQRVGTYRIEDTMITLPIGYLKMVSNNEAMFILWDNYILPIKPDTQTIFTTHTPINGEPIFGIIIYQENKIPKYATLEITSDADEIAIETCLYSKHEINKIDQQWQNILRRGIAMFGQANKQPHLSIAPLPNSRPLLHTQPENK